MIHEPWHGHAAQQRLQVPLAVAHRRALDVVRADDLGLPLELRAQAKVLLHPAMSDDDRATTIVEALVDMPGVEEVFGADLEILAVARRHAQD